MHNEHHYHQEEESGAVIPSLSALISGAKRCQGEVDALCPGHRENKPSWEPQTSLYILKHLTLPPAVLDGLWRPLMLVAAGHVCLGLAALPPASRWKQRAGLCLLLWELWRGNVGQGTHQGGWDNSHPWFGELFAIFVAAFPTKWNDFLGEAQSGATFSAWALSWAAPTGWQWLPHLSAGPPSALHTWAAAPVLLQTWGAAGKIPLCPSFPSFYPNGCQAL